MESLKNPLTPNFKMRKYNFKKDTVYKMPGIKCVNRKKTKKNKKKSKKVRKKNKKTKVKRKIKK